MSNFEFMQRMTLGQYLPTGSIIHRLDPRVRLVIFAVLVGVVTLTRSLPGLVFSLGLACLGLMVARISLRYALRGLLPPLPFLLVLAVLQVLLSPGEGQQALVSFWLIRITPAGLMTGGMLVLRFASLILWLSLGSFTLSTSELILGLNRLLRPLGWLGLPVEDLVLMVQVTMRFIPLLTREAEQIVKAQASRGAPWGKGSGGALRRARQALPMIVPLFLNSLRRAENMALAMDARGYGSHEGRTSMYALEFKFMDGLALGVGLILAGVILVMPGI